MKNAFYKQVLEFYFTPFPTLGYSIFSKNYQIAALYCTYCTILQKYFFIHWFYLYVLSIYILYSLRKLPVVINGEKSISNLFTDNWLNIYYKRFTICEKVVIKVMKMDSFEENIKYEAQLREIHNSKRNISIQASRYNWLYFYILSAFVWYCYLTFVILFVWNW